MNAPRFFFRPECLTLIVAALCSAGTARAEPTVLFVAPAGDDNWSEALDAPNEIGTDGPFRTLARARDALRELKTAGGGMLLDSATVYLRDGDYYLDAPLVFGPEDSGTPDNPIAYAAY